VEASDLSTALLTQTDGRLAAELLRQVVNCWNRQATLETQADIHFPCQVLAVATAFGLRRRPARAPQPAE